MHSKNHRVNHNFQIQYFLSGMCHTPDGAYALLSDLLEDREQAVKHHAASVLKTRAANIRAERAMCSMDEAVRLDGEAMMAELEAGREQGEACYQAALDEIAFIKYLMAELPRKYAHLPDSEAHEATQQEEWRLELIHRAENFLLTSGTIPADHLSTMRAHPEFQTSIAPAIEELSARLKQGELSLVSLPRPVLYAKENLL